MFFTFIDYFNTHEFCRVLKLLRQYIHFRVVFALFSKDITTPGKDFHDASRDGRDKSHVWLSQLTQSV